MASATCAAYEFYDNTDNTDNICKRNMRLPCRCELSVPIYLFVSQGCTCCAAYDFYDNFDNTDNICKRNMRLPCRRSELSVPIFIQSGLRMLRSQCCRCCRSIISCCQSGLRVLRSQCCLCCQCCRSLHPSILFKVVFVVNVVVYIHLTPVSPIYCSPSPTKEEERKKRVLSICWFSPVCVRLFFFILPHTLHNFSTLPTTKYI